MADTGKITRRNIKINGGVGGIIPASINWQRNRVANKQLEENQFHICFSQLDGWAVSRTVSA